MTPDDIYSLIRNVPDFPKPGIQFKDISPVLSHGPGFRKTIELLAERVPPAVEVIAAPEARGFIFGTAIAHVLEKGFVPIRKPGKLPHDTVEVTYDLEYGQDTVQMHADAVTTGQKVMLVDDVLATGGTMRACADLVEQQGAHIAGCLFFLELGFLGGRSKLGDYVTWSLFEE